VFATWRRRAAYAERGGLQLHSGVSALPLVLVITRCPRCSSIGAYCVIVRGISRVSRRRWRRRRGRLSTAATYSSHVEAPLFIRPTSRRCRAGTLHRHDLRHGGNFRHRDGDSTPASWAVIRMRSPHPHRIIISAPAPSWFRCDGASAGAATSGSWCRRSRRRAAWTRSPGARSTGSVSCSI